MTEKKRRQGQRGATPKHICPKCGEYLKRNYTRELVEGKQQFEKGGWTCPSKACDYITKDLEGIQKDKENFVFNLQQAYEEYLRERTDRNLGRYEGIAKVAGFMGLTNREVKEAEVEVQEKVKTERGA